MNLLESTQLKERGEGQDSETGWFARPESRHQNTIDLDVDIGRCQEDAQRRFRLLEALRFARSMLTAIKTAYVASARRSEAMVHSAKW